MSSRYSRLNTAEPEADSTSAKKAHSDRVERISSKVHALFWVGVAGGTIHYTDFINVALNDDRVKRTALNLCVTCIVFNIGLALYLMAYLPWFKNVSHDSVCVCIYVCIYVFIHIHHVSFLCLFIF
jgi:hypothetical protein